MTATVRRLYIFSNTYYIYYMCCRYVCACACIGRVGVYRDDGFNFRASEYVLEFLQPSESSFEIELL